MSIVKMRKVSLVAHKKEKEAILQILQNNGLMHITNIEQSKIFAQTKYEEVLLEYNLVTHILDILSKFKAKKHDIPPKVKNFEETLSILKNIITDYDNITNNLELINKKIALYEPFGNYYDNPLVFNLINVSAKFAILDEKSYQLLTSEKVAFEILNKQKNIYYVVIFLEKDQKTSVGCIDIPKEINFFKEKELLEEKLKVISNNFSMWSYQYINIENYQKELANNCDRLLEEKKLWQEEKLIGLCGYIMQAKEEEFIKSLKNYSVALQIEDPTNNDEVPVYFKHNLFSQGFVFVLKTFSGLSYFEKDKTFIVSLFFIIFGSICLMDAGYGVMLTLLGYLLLIKKNNDIGKMCIWTGVFSTILGLLCGQVFGLVVSKDIFLHLTPVLNLATDSLACFKFSLITGVATLCLANLVIIYEVGFKTNALGNLCAIFAAISLLCSKFIVVHSFYDVSLILQNTAYFLLIIALLSWSLFPENSFGKDKHIANVLWTLYASPVGLIQDTLSHMRLFGIALSGSILALVVNKISASMPFFIASVFVPLAHFVIFLLSLLSLYIHTNRLIFLEFGSKCIKGGQHYFTPFFRRY